MSFQSFRHSRWYGLLMAILSGFVVSTTVIGLRNLDFLEQAELLAYDYLIRMRAKPGQDPRILLVAIDDRALTKLNSDKISDLTLTEVIKKLEQKQPSVISVDILRDVPIGEGREQLLQYLNDRYDPLAREIKPILMACKLPSQITPEGIDPPPVIDLDSAVGFVDLNGDPENIFGQELVRRFWISSIPAPGVSNENSTNSEQSQESIAAKEDGCYVPFSLGFLTALSYLQKENINLDLSEDKLFKLNDIVFEPLEKKTGSYNNLDPADYHKLLDYWYEEPVEQVSLVDVLEDRIDPEQVKDKIVYIGYVTKNDIHQTPFGTKPGVLIHAWSTSQVLGNVLDNRPVIWYWSESGEWLWIYSWGLIGAAIVLGSRRYPNWILYSGQGAALIILFGTSFYIFTGGGWIPLIPPAITLVAAAVASKTTLSIFPEKEESISPPEQRSSVTAQTVLMPNRDRGSTTETVIGDSIPETIDENRSNTPPDKNKTVVESNSNTPADKDKTVVESKSNTPPDKNKTVVESKSNTPPDKNKTVVESKSNTPPDKDKTVVESKSNTPPDKDKTLVENRPTSSSKREFVRSDPLINTSLGDDRYQIKKQLGQGGMSKVYLAEDTRLSDKKVAIKIMINPYSSIDSESLIKRFQREVKFISGLTSPNIVQISDFGIMPTGISYEGSPFYVMEYLVGKTLKQRIEEKGALSPEEALPILLQVCYALTEAHQQNIIHRDLKPDNIFLIDRGDFGEQVKILDFGIAKAIIEQDNEQQTKGLTEMGSFVGTYQYASPEQCSGMPNIDQRSDIYSLGIILYETLAGTNPFNIDSKTTTGPNWAISHISRPPQPLRRQKGCEDLPVELEQIVMKCLQKDTFRRYRNVKELIKSMKKLMK